MQDLHGCVEVIDSRAAVVDKAVLVVAGRQKGGCWDRWLLLQLCMFGCPVARVGRAGCMVDAAAVRCKAVVLKGSCLNGGRGAGLSCGKDRLVRPCDAQPWLGGML